MRSLIVSGDQHISVKKDIPIEWQLNRFRLLFKSYVDLCKKHSADLILTGDLFHAANENKWEKRLFLELINLLEREEIRTHIIIGNHENMGAQGSTLDYFQPDFDNLDWVQYHPTISFKKEEGCELVFVGHNQLQAWLDSGDTEWEGTRIIFSHFRPTVNKFIQEEIDVQKFISTSSLCICSDIHLPLTLCDGRLVYTNSPLNTHFEPKPDCGCLLLTLDSGEVSYKRLVLSLPNLIQITTTASAFEDTVDTVDYYRIEVTGTPEELRSIKTESPNTKLLKIPELQETYAELEVTKEVKDQSLQDALIGYMQELQMSEGSIQKMMEIINEP